MALINFLFQRIDLILLQIQFLFKLQISIMKIFHLFQFVLHKNLLFPKLLCLSYRNLDQLAVIDPFFDLILKFNYSILLLFKPIRKLFNLNLQVLFLGSQLGYVLTLFGPLCFKILIILKFHLCDTTQFLCFDRFFLSFNAYCFERIIFQFLIFKLFLNLFQFFLDAFVMLI